MAIEYDVPVMFHSGDTYSPTGRIKYSHPIHIDDLAVDFPELKIVDLSRRQSLDQRLYGGDV